MSGRHSLLVIHKLKYHLSHRWVTYGSRKELINVFTTSHHQHIKRSYLCFLLTDPLRTFGSTFPAPIPVFSLSWKIFLTPKRHASVFVLSAVKSTPVTHTHSSRVPECILCVLTGLKPSNWRALLNESYVRMMTWACMYSTPLERN